jgi:hypothetical protein
MGTLKHTVLTAIALLLVSVSMLLTVAERHRMKVYPKVSGLAAWSENCKCVPVTLGSVVSLFCESF